MGLHLFPEHLHSVRSSKHETALKIFRFVAVVILVLDIVLLFVLDVFTLSSVFTWYFFLALLFELFAALSYFVHDLDKVASVLFVVAWPIVGSLGLFLIYLCILLNVIDIVTLSPLVLLLVDFLLNKINIVRLQYIFTFIVFLPLVIYEFNEFYVLSFALTDTALLILKVLLIVIAFGIAELSRLAKVRSCKEDHEHVHSLL